MINCINTIAFGCKKEFCGNKDFRIDTLLFVAAIVTVIGLIIGKIYGSQYICADPTNIHEIIGQYILLTGAVLLLLGSLGKICTLTRQILSTNEKIHADSTNAKIDSI